MDERQRLVKIMESEGLNAKQFSQQVGISSGTLSNILGGRNKPSLDVMQAVLNRFRTISSDWLILDAGPMYRMNGDGPQTTLFDIKPETHREPENSPENETACKVSIVNSTPDASLIPPRKVEKIVIFYSDGTFEQR
ncbi:MAG: helix-turn-helix transcriptional regulator [Paludibacteraceae bacterium]|nr:helix-turn-helix transcriptional regulator [Paludibacteraceae bacterium]